MTRKVKFTEALNKTIVRGVVHKLIFDLSGKRRVGTCVHFNSHTVWVKVMKGARTYDIIKRHRKKHHVKMPFSLMGGGHDETFYS